MSEDNPKILFPHPRLRRFSDLPSTRWWAFFILTYRTLEVLFFKLIQICRIYRPRRSIVGIPSLATRSFTTLQASVYNGTQEEILGFRPRHFFYRLIKGVPDLEYFERVELRLAITKNYTHSVQLSTGTKGFVHAQVPWQLPWHPPTQSECKIVPLGSKTLLGTIRLGDYDIEPAPVFFMTEKIKHVIVSDIDDTIKDSGIKHATSFKSVMGSIFRGHYYQYAAIEGMSELYQELKAQGALIIYLTSTPYQLTPFLLKFLKDNHFPLGPVFPRWLGYGQFRHKWKSLHKIFSTMNDQKCFLVGDSGEKDLSIYQRIAANPAFSDRVEKILIRNVPDSGPLALKSPKEISFEDVRDLRSHFASILN